MSSKVPEFKYDAIILHSEDELLDAVEFCNVVKTNISLDRPLEIVTFEEFSVPGTIIQNLENAINAARFIFCSEYHYHTDEFGTFAGQVAIMEKLPDKLVKVSTGKNVGETSVMRAVSGIRLQENWKVSPHVLEKLRRLFSSTPDETKDRSPNRDPDQNTAMSELSAAEYYHQQESLSELSSESYLVVENPSLPTADYSSGESAINNNEAEHRRAFTPRPQKAQTSKPGGLERRGPLTTTVGSANLPGEDLDEDSEQGVATGTNTVPEAPGKAQAAASPFLVKRRAFSQSEQSADPVPAPPSTDAEEDRGNPSATTFALYCCIIFCVAVYCIALSLRK